LEPSETKTIYLLTFLLMHKKTQEFIYTCIYIIYKTTLI